MIRGNVKKKNWDDLTYEYFYKGRNRGEVRVHTSSGVRIIPTFPHIKRVYTLNGFKKHFNEDKVWVEEKVDGYNIRAVYIDGKIYGFTRGGVVCPFSTEKLRENHALIEFFKDHPQFIVNGEMAGPHNPYITQWPDYVKEDVVFFVFDMMDKNRFLPVSERIKLVKEYGLSSVRSFGLLDLDEIKQVVLDNYKKMEGIVMKDEERKKAIKYVFPDSDIDDIRVTASIFPEVNAGYFLQRLVRSAMFLEENGIPMKDYFEVVGRAFLEPFAELAKNIREGGEVWEDYTIIVKNPNTAYDLVELLSEHIRVDVVDMDKRDDKYWVTIRKYYQNATSFWRERVHGHAFVD